MNRMRPPPRAKRSMVWNTDSRSAKSSAAVTSSRMSIRGRRTSARARTTSCCAASGRRPAGASRSNRVVERSSASVSAAMTRRCARGIPRAQKAVAAEKDVVERAPVGSDQHLLKDRREAEGLEHRRREALDFAARRRELRRGSEARRPDRSLTSVLLPEPFSPRMA